MTHVVTRRLPMGSEVLEPGTEVDASEWLHTDKLVSQRYLKPIQPDGRDKRMGRKENNGSKSGN